MLNGNGENVKHFQQQYSTLSNRLRNVVSKNQPNLSSSREVSSSLLQSFSTATRESAFLEILHSAKHFLVEVEKLETSIAANKDDNFSQKEQEGQEKSYTMCLSPAMSSYDLILHLLQEHIHINAVDIGDLDISFLSHGSSTNETQFFSQQIFKTNLSLTETVLTVLIKDTLLSLKTNKFRQCILDFLPGFMTCFMAIASHQSLLSVNPTQKRNKRNKDNSMMDEKESRNRKIDFLSSLIIASFKTILQSDSDSLIPLIECLSYLPLSNNKNKTTMGSREDRILQKNVSVSSAKQEAFHIAVASLQALPLHLANNSHNHHDSLKSIQNHWNVELPIIVTCMLNHITSFDTGLEAILALRNKFVTLPEILDSMDALPPLSTDEWNILTTDNSSSVTNKTSHEMSQNSYILLIGYIFIDRIIHELKEYEKRVKKANEESSKESKNEIMNCYVSEAMAFILGRDVSAKSEIRMNHSSYYPHSCNRFFQQDQEKKSQSSSTNTQKFWSLIDVMSLLILFCTPGEIESFVKNSSDPDITIMDFASLTSGNNKVKQQVHMFLMHLIPDSHTNLYDNMSSDNFVDYLLHGLHNLTDHLNQYPHDGEIDATSGTNGYFHDEFYFPRNPSTTSKSDSSIKNTNKSFILKSEKIIRGALYKILKWLLLLPSNCTSGTTLNRKKAHIFSKAPIPSKKLSSLFVKVFKCSDSFTRKKIVALLMYTSSSSFINSHFQDDNQHRYNGVLEVARSSCDILVTITKQYTNYMMKEEIFLKQIIDCVIWALLSVRSSSSSSSIYNSGVDNSLYYVDVLSLCPEIIHRYCEIICLLSIPRSNINDHIFNCDFFDDNDENYFYSLIGNPNKLLELSELVSLTEKLTTPPTPLLFNNGSMDERQNQIQIGMILAAHLIMDCQAKIDQTKKQSLLNCVERAIKSVNLYEENESCESSQDKNSRLNLCIHGIRFLTSLFTNNERHRINNDMISSSVENIISWIGLIQQKSLQTISLQGQKNLSKEVEPIIPTTSDDDDKDQSHPIMNLNHISMTFCVNKFYQSYFPRRTTDDCGYLYDDNYTIYSNTKQQNFYSSAISSPATNTNTAKQDDPRKSNISRQLELTCIHNLLNLYFDLLLSSETEDKIFYHHLLEVPNWPNFFSYLDDDGIYLYNKSDGNNNRIDKQKKKERNKRKMNLLNMLEEKGRQVEEGGSKESSTTNNNNNIIQEQSRQGSEDSEDDCNIQSTSKDKSDNTTTRTTTSQNNTETQAISYPDLWRFGATVTSSRIDYKGTCERLIDTMNDNEHTNCTTLMKQNRNRVEILLSTAWTCLLSMDICRTIIFFHFRRERMDGSKELKEHQSQQSVLLLGCFYDMRIRASICIDLLKKYIEMYSSQVLKQKTLASKKKKTKKVKTKGTKKSDSTAIPKNIVGNYRFMTTESHENNISNGIHFDSVLDQNEKSLPYQEQHIFNEENLEQEINNLSDGLQKQFFMMFEKDMDYTLGSRTTYYKKSNSSSTVRDFINILWKMIGIISHSSSSSSQVIETKRFHRHLLNLHSCIVEHLFLCLDLLQTQNTQPQQQCLPSSKSFNYINNFTFLICITGVLSPLLPDIRKYEMGSSSKKSTNIEVDTTESTSAIPTLSEVTDLVSRHYELIIQTLKTYFERNSINDSDASNELLKTIRIAVLNEQKFLSNNDSSDTINHDGGDMSFMKCSYITDLLVQPVMGASLKSKTKAIPLPTFQKIFIRLLEKNSIHHKNDRNDGNNRISDERDVDLVIVYYYFATQLLYFCEDSYLATQLLDILSLLIVISMNRDSIATAYESDSETSISTDKNNIVSTATTKYLLQISKEITWKVLHTIYPLNSNKHEHSLKNKKVDKLESFQTRSCCCALDSLIIHDCRLSIIRSERYFSPSDSRGDNKDEHGYNMYKTIDKAIWNLLSTSDALNATATKSNKSNNNMKDQFQTLRHFLLSFWSFSQALCFYHTRDSEETTTSIPSLSSFIATKSLLENIHEITIPMEIQTLWGALLEGNGGMEIPSLTASLHNKSVHFYLELLFDILFASMTLFTPPHFRKNIKKKNPFQILCDLSHIFIGIILYIVHTYSDNQEEKNDDSTSTHHSRSMIHQLYITSSSFESTIKLLLESLLKYTKLVQIQVKSCINWRNAQPIYFSNSHGDDNGEEHSENLEKEKYASVFHLETLLNRLYLSISFIKDFCRMIKVMATTNNNTTKTTIETTDDLPSSSAVGTTRVVGRKQKMDLDEHIEYNDGDIPTPSHFSNHHHTNNFFLRFFDNSNHDDKNKKKKKKDGRKRKKTGPSIWSILYASHHKSISSIVVKCEQCLEYLQSVAKSHNLDLVDLDSEEDEEFEFDMESVIDKNANNSSKNNKQKVVDLDNIHDKKAFYKKSMWLVTEDTTRNYLRSTSILLSSLSSSDNGEPKHHSSTKRRSRSRFLFHFLSPLEQQHYTIEGDDDNDESLLLAGEEKGGTINNDHSCVDGEMGNIPTYVGNGVGPAKNTFEEKDISISTGSSSDDDEFFDDGSDSDSFGVVGDWG